MLSYSEWQGRTDAALEWLRRSIEATDGQGSSHSYSPLFGWAPAYPETTGYLIGTLLDYAALKDDNALRQLAANCVDWLLHLQMPDGAFPAGKVSPAPRPSVFNTSQILFGLERFAALPPCQDALERAVVWLLKVLDPDGAWRQAAYVPGFVPSYYTRAVWGVLTANKILQQPGIQEKMRAALHFYAARFLPNGAVRDWGFQPGRTAFTHTIAYTLEGFLESALLLGETVILEKTLNAATQLLAIRQAAAKTAGAYDAHWRGDYSFLCPAGNAQLSVLFFRMAEVTKDPRFKEASWLFLEEMLDCQRFGKNQNTHGAIPGSRPFWGKYLRGRYPNWAAKFYLDAMLNFCPTPF